MADVTADARHAVAAVAHARAQRAAAVEGLARLVRFPSVSVDPRRASDVARCARYLAEELRRMGLEHVRVEQTPRHPLVWARWARAPGRPTLLVYGHYDVQPADGVWRIPPFEPAVRGSDMFGRGASDDKGQLSTHLRALEALLATRRRLPLNVVVLLDGEEEIGSPSLPAFLSRRQRELDCDAAVMSDTRMLGPGRPAITYSLRGSLSLELEVHANRNELHSGNFGGAVANPLQTVAEIVASLHRRDGVVAVAGFYDDVHELSGVERIDMAVDGPSDEEILRAAGRRRGSGEPGFTLYERTTIRPAVTLNGIVGGYSGPGGKAVIPARATAKLNVRLVPDQRPERIEALLRAHVARVVPPGVRWSLQRGSAALPAVIDRSHPAMRAAEAAYRRGFGVEATFVRSGGTIPIVGLLERTLGVPTVLLGFALPDDRIHAANEKFHLPNLFRGTDTCIWFYEQFAATASPSLHGRPAIPRPRRRGATGQRSGPPTTRRLRRRVRRGAT
jgi:acetylornithine deacetylase/succinyl-diaminopimelate desuccinylase-like protein